MWSKHFASVVLGISTSLRRLPEEYEYLICNMITDKTEANLEKTSEYRKTTTSRLREDTHRLFTDFINVARRLCISI